MVAIAICLRSSFALCKLRDKACINLFGDILLSYNAVTFQPSVKVSDARGRAGWSI